MTRTWQCTIVPTRVANRAAGKMDQQQSSLYPTPPAGDTWQPNLACGMASAYAVAHGGEPNFTNYAQASNYVCFHLARNRSYSHQ